MAFHGLHWRNLLEQVTNWFAFWSLSSPWRGRCHLRELLFIRVHDGVVYFPLFLSLPSRTEIQPYLEGRRAVVRGPFSR